VFGPPTSVTRPSPTARYARAVAAAVFATLALVTAAGAGPGQAPEPVERAGEGRRTASPAGGGP
jgi:hypothetical protein